MITLCGFALSNYYNKVKMALIEKNIPFSEQPVKLPLNEDELVFSPLGKVPYLKTANGALCESQVIMDYLERAYPQTPLLPSDAFQASKQLELVTFIELHLELLVRQLYGQAFFGRGEAPEAVRASVQKQLVKNIAAFKKIAHFTPLLGGTQLSQADIAAFVHLPLVGSATKIVYGTDMLLDVGIDWKSYVKTIGERPSAVKVNADKKDYLAAQAS
jgi:glutathione S-transferase